MRIVVLLLLAGLAGCAQPAGALLAAEAATTVVLGRGIVDLGVSAITGRDCSLVRLDRGQTYCAPRTDVLAAVPFCTRSLGTVDCWADPSLLPGVYRGVADTPSPTEAQKEYRAARWPKSLNGLW